MSASAAMALKARFGAASTQARSSVLNSREVFTIIFIGFLLLINVGA
jgi:hypothetical protein